MDLKVSRKETRIQPSGPVDELVDGVFDIYPVYDRVDPGLIVDVEMLDGGEAEVIDRALSATVWQRGQDPVDPGEGIQWAEAVLGEVPAPVIVRQLQDAVNAEGPGIKITFDTVTNGTKSYMRYKIELLKTI
jgi:hypothetical protein